MQFRMANPLLPLCLSVFLGCAGSTTSPASTSPTDPRSRPTLPIVPPMGQCFDASEDEDLETKMIGDLIVVRIHADAFVDLEPSHRVLAYHLASAATSGNTLGFAERSPQGIILKQMAEELALHLQAVPESIRSKVELFLQQVFIHKGVYDTWTRRKVEMPLTESELGAALDAVVRSGANLPGGDAGKLMKDLGPLLFDPAHEPVLPESNTRKASRNASSLHEVIAPLKEASRHADPSHRGSLVSLLSYLETGSSKAFEQHLAAEASSVTWTMGMFPMFRAPPGLDGFWAGVWVEDRETQALLGKLASTKLDLGGVSVRMNHRLPPRAGIPLSWTGTAGPSSLGAFTLTSDQSMRTWVITPILDASAKLRSRFASKGFLPDPSRKADFTRCLPHAYRARDMLRELVGRSSRPPVDTAGTISPLDRVVLEEARANLIALVASWDPELVALGLIPDTTCAQIMADLVALDHLMELRNVRSGSKLETVDLRASSLIVRYALDQGALRETVRDRQLHLEITDQDRWREAVRTLAVEVLDIEGKGDGKRARNLLARFADETVPQWRESARSRAKEVGLPSRIAFLTPRLKAFRDETGAIEDATLVESLSIIDMALVDGGKIEMP